LELRDSQIAREGWEIQKLSNSRIEEDLHLGNYYQVVIFVFGNMIKKNIYFTHFNSLDNWIVSFSSTFEQDSKKELDVYTRDQLSIWR